MIIETKGIIYNFIDEDNIIITRKFLKSQIYQGSCSRLVVIEYGPFNTLRGEARILTISLPNKIDKIITEMEIGDFIKIDTIYRKLIKTCQVDIVSRLKACSYVHPEIKEEILIKKKEKQDTRDKEHNESLRKREQEKSEITEKKRSIAGCKMKEEVKHKCVRCGVEWYSGKFEEYKNLSNALAFNQYGVNNLKDINKCPKCGSRATTAQKVRYWVDKKGNTTYSEK